LMMHRRSFQGMNDAPFLRMSHSSLFRPTIPQNPKTPKPQLHEDKLNNPHNHYQFDY